jgi:hypothetical protein
MDWVGVDGLAIDIQDWSIGQSGTLKGGKFSKDSSSGQTELVE